ncbi:hypothetical protein CDAR_215931 [Caerostris darwini]|uniref:Uncharacterized protein n=1 Tax=Caerostris darwini TaxID=1538125 RepID=A0AAV4NJT1_9ARAC|nr:hypothetical protein CDAR_215931 [Caerostris darwini]
MCEDNIFIPTFPPEERTRMVKFQEFLREMDPSSRDVYEANIIDRYIIRPAMLDVGMMVMALQYVALSLSRVTSAAGLSILDNYSLPPPPQEDDPILQELKRLRGRSPVPKLKFCVNLVSPIH